MLNIGPPELPTLIAASVWNISALNSPPYIRSVDRRALIWPTVSVWVIPRGAPTMKIGSPTFTLSESPSLAAKAAVGGFSSFSTARSAAGTEPVTFAPIISPLVNWTWISSAT